MFVSVCFVFVMTGGDDGDADGDDDGGGDVDYLFNYADDDVVG